MHRLSHHFQSFVFPLKNRKGTDYKGGSIRTGVAALSAYVFTNYKRSISTETDKDLFKVVDAKLKGLAKLGKDETDSAVPFSADQEKALLNSL